MAAGYYKINSAPDIMTTRLNGRGDYQIIYVAAKVGYDNPLYFSRLFRKRTGMSPREYKKQKQMNRKLRMRCRYKLICDRR